MSELVKYVIEENGFEHISAMILDLYSEPHRKYHNVGHIEDLIRAASANGYSEYDTIMKAILFHDVVYYPCCRYNEELSADVYWSNKPVLFESPEFYDIFDAIKASKDHTAAGNANLTHWAKDFLDFDLMGLMGEKYRENGVKIWQEYKPFVTTEQFIEGRKAFLKKMLFAPQIYWNHEEWEEAARRNMAEELTELEQGVFKFMEDT